MAIYRNPNPKSKQSPRSRSLLVSISTISLVFLLVLFSSSIPNSRFSNSSDPTYDSVEIKHKKEEIVKWKEKKYLYWGNRIDCPGKHCDSWEGLGHQESSLRCALEEALFLKWVFVMPSRMCINPIHNKKGILHHLRNASSEERWAASSCSMDSLYDMDLISETIPVILDNSKTWYRVLSTSMKSGKMGMTHVEGISRFDLKDSSIYSNVMLINLTASPLSWFMECKDRNDRSSIMLSYSFLPTMAARKLRDAADKIKELLGDYDAIHVRRGDKIKTRKDRHGVDRTLHPHLDRDTQPEFIKLRIAKWIPPGRTLFIASNERSPDFFSPLSARYKLAYSSNYSGILDPLIVNNYQLFMVERLILSGATTFVNTFKGDESDLRLTDDPKKNMKKWQIPVYTLDGAGTRVSPYHLATSFSTILQKVRMF